MGLFNSRPQDNSDLEDEQPQNRRRRLSNEFEPRRTRRRLDNQDSDEVLQHPPQPPPEPQVQELRRSPRLNRQEPRLGQSTILRLALESVLLRIITEEVENEVRTEVFYFIGSFLVGMGDRLPSNQQRYSHGEIVRVELQAEIEADDVIDLPMMIIGTRDNSSANGWLMYVFGGSNTQESLERINCLEEPRILGTRGNFVISLQASLANILESLFTDVSGEEVFRPLSALVLSQLLEHGDVDYYQLFTRLSELLPAEKRSVESELVEAQLPSTLANELTNKPKQCPVCLTDFEDTEHVRVLKCGHVFHKECIDTWLTQHVNNCPLCRKEAVELFERRE